MFLNHEELIKLELWRLGIGGSPSEEEVNKVYSTAKESF